MSAHILQTIALETYARRSFNYLSRMVDQDSLPYFNVFWSAPAQAAHDWPDFGDVMSRQLQGAVMARAMTGERVLTEPVWLAKLLSYLDATTGLLTRPDTIFSKRVADAGDGALTLYALVTAFLLDHDEALRQVIYKMVDSMLEKAGNGVDGGFLGGFGIKSAMACARFMSYSPALRLAEKMVHKVFVETPLFSPDNTFRHGGHMHGNLRILVGAADYALYTHDAVLYSRVDAIYRYVRSTATRFGFMPEAIGRQGDIVSCETCALMDYLGLAVTLANHGHPEYWGDVERVLRNQMIESQVTDGSWLHSDPSRADTLQFTWHEIGERMVGGYAGWTSPNHILAARETLNHHWGGPELHDKTRAFQNCCGGSGTHAFFEVWKNAARFQDGWLNVYLHLDKRLPQAEIRGFQPYTGLLTIHLKEDCPVRVRVPEFTTAAELRIESSRHGALEPKAWGNFIELPDRQAGEMIKVAYPLPVYSEEVTIGNPGFRQYHYRTTWKGDTVVKMEPLDNDQTMGYSDFDKKEVPIFYGEDGPGQLYQRQHLIPDVEPGAIALAPLHLDNGALDLWFFS